jgi:GWxTD domain-containing protein
LWSNRRHRLYNFNAEDYLMPLDALNLKSAARLTRPALAAILLTPAALVTGFSVLAQSPSTSQKFIASDDTPSPLAGPYRTWLDQDVRWIIAPDERSAYTALVHTNAERQQFIIAFWERRNPNPGSSENKFKEEHYRRLAYSNEHFASGRPGWKSDRGHVYIVHGKPDSIDAYPTGGASGSAPFEVWHYNLIRGKDSMRDWTLNNVDFKFVDTCHCGDYKLTAPLP